MLWIVLLIMLLLFLLISCLLNEPYDNEQGHSVENGFTRQK